jgi:dTDP-4-dehydrorhamnose 3,5-epimerase
MSLPRLIVPKRHPDERGWFAETFNEARLRALGIDCRFVQDNQSYSQRAGTLRGMHFQAPPFEQAKLISMLRGRALDVAVDVRRGSPTSPGSTPAHTTRCSMPQTSSAPSSTGKDFSLVVPRKLRRPCGKMR